VEQERSAGSKIDPTDLTPEDDSAKGWFKLACFLASKGKAAEAERSLKIALDLQDVFPIAWAILSAILLSKGSETDAEQAGKKAISQCAGLKMTWPKMRTIIISNAIIRGASWKDPRKVVIEAVTSSEWGNLLSILSKASQQELDEITTFEESPIKKEESDIVDESPEQDDPSVWFLAAESFLKQGNLVDAEKAFRGGLRIDPNNGDAWLSVSSLLMGKHKYDEAIDALENATQQIPANSAAWYQLAYCFQKLNKWKQAIQPIRNAINLERNNPDYWMLLGLSEFHLGKYQDSAKSLLKTLRISPNHKDALFYLAMCMERRGNRKHALSLYIKLLNLGRLPPGMFERMAGAFERLNRPSEARESRRRAGVALNEGIQ
jgi:tetratricopeptide (TPR) repeat protein